MLSMMRAGVEKELLIEITGLLFNNWFTVRTLHEKNKLNFVSLRKK